MKSKTNFLLILFSINTLISFAQLNPNIIGDASIQGNNCFVITPDALFQSGGVYYNNPIDFAEDFTIYYQCNFGSKDFTGADGMAIVFKRDFIPELGATGGGLSYQGISNSLIVEFDTWQNLDGNDPSFDHIAIMKNGDSNHGNSINNLAGPIQASSTSANIEDGNAHEIKIEWLATQRLFVVYFDCLERLRLNLDIKNSIFAGDDSVFFGFVGSTGGNSNVHQVCLNRVSFVDDLQLQDVAICDQGSIKIDATIASGVSYRWEPILGVSNPNVADPTFFPNNTTTYTVAIADVCGDQVVEDVTINVLPNVDPIFDPIAPICAGDALNPLPLISNNNITGFWTPSLNNTATTTYTFISTSNPCANSVTTEIVVNPLEIPVFDAIPSICEGDALANLPTVSNNGISGSWSPALNNLTTTTYTFTPDPVQGCIDTTSLDIIVNPILQPVFDFETTICEGSTFQLPTTSNNGIEGNWTPNFNTSISQEYTFTPNPGICAIPIDIQITITPIIETEFDIVDSICEGEQIGELPSISDNGIEGEWTPSINNTATTLYTFTPFEDACATIFIKEIKVIPNVTPTFNYPITSICPGEEIMTLPSQSLNGISGTWSPALNNQLTTTYTFTPNIDEICALETTLTVIVTEPILPDFDIIQFICFGDIIEPLPQISNNGITGVWSPELDNTTTTTYTFTPNLGQCSTPTEIEIEVLEVNELSIDVIINSIGFDDNQSVTVNVTGGTGDYEYRLDDLQWQNENSFNRIRGCEEHIIRVREASGCSNVAAETFRILEYPKYFTPNGDAQNDLWNIECLSEQIGARITIYNRYGKVLATIDPSNMGWNGDYNNSPLPSSDYWFKVDYLNNDGSPQTFVSHFSLKR